MLIYFSKLRLKTRTHGQRPQPEAASQRCSLSGLPMFTLTASRCGRGGLNVQPEFAPWKQSGAVSFKLSTCTTNNFFLLPSDSILHYDTSADPESVGMGPHHDGTAALCLRVQLEMAAAAVGPARLLNTRPGESCQELVQWAVNPPRIPLTKNQGRLLRLRACTVVTISARRSRRGRAVAATGGPGPGEGRRRLFIDQLLLMMPKWFALQ